MISSPDAFSSSTSAKATLRRIAIFLALLEPAFSRKAVSSRSKAAREAGGRAFGEDEDEDLGDCFFIFIPILAASF